METRAIRDLTVLLSGDDPDDLPQLDGLPHDGGTISRRRITGALARARITETTLSGCWLVNADLSSTEFESVMFDRCLIRNSTLIGARLADVLLKNVIFEYCQLRGVGLRGNDLSGVVGIGCLRGVTISEDQLPGITEGLTRELSLEIK